MKINFSAVAFSNGIALCGLGSVMCVPLIYDILFLKAAAASIFVPSIVVCAFLGISTVCAYKPRDFEVALSRNDAFLIVSSLWVVISLFSSFPFYFYNQVKLSFISSLFESTSGITTTGVSVYGDIEILPRALNLWRFMLHFVGGVGIVAIGVVASPFMRIGGMQLFLTENSEKFQKFFPRASQMAKFFVGTYIAIIGLFSILLKLSGMGAFDAVCHSISAISTGGFSTRNSGIQYYNNSLIELILLFAMLFGGITFLEVTKCFKNGLGHLFKNQQIRGYLILALIAAAIPTLYIVVKENTTLSLKSIVDSWFNIISALTTTGFELEDNFFQKAFAKIFLLTLAFIGGCSGSTAGGIKIFRLQILLSILKNYLKRLTTPFEIGYPEYQNKKIEDKSIFSIVSFLFLFVTTFFISVVLICVVSDFSIGQSIPLVFSCLLNLGSSADYASLTDLSKIVLSIDMLLGRLEVVPLVIILSRSFWKR